MADTLYTGLTVDVRQVKDSSVELTPDGEKYVAELPGFIQFGVTVGGVWVTLLQIKAPGLLADIERAKSPQPAPPAEG